MLCASIRGMAMIRKSLFGTITRITGLVTVTALAFSQQNAPIRPVPELRTDVRLVLLDILVTDIKGNPIPNLKPEDFTVLENGASQTVKAFEDHTALPALKAADPVSDLSSPPGTYTNRPKPQPNLWNIIVVDQLNTPPDAQGAAREALRTFAAQLRDGAPVALLTITASSVKMLVPFTSNGAEISKLLDNSDILFSTPSPLVDAFNSDDQYQLDRALSPHLLDAAGNPMPIPGVENIKDSFRESEMDQLSTRVGRTLWSLNRLAIWLEHLPGKKNLYWLSAGFPLSAEPLTVTSGDDDDFLGPRWFRAYNQLQHETDTRLEAARVAIFPLDVRGNQGCFEGIDCADQANQRYVKSALKYSDDVKHAAVRLNAEHAEMENIAKETGGVAHYNRNDLAQQLSEQFQRGQSYYTLAYEPTNSNWNGKFRRIALTVKDHSYRLSYREGYFADTLTTPPKDPAEALIAALRHTAPPSTSVLFKVDLDKSVPGKLGLRYTVDPHTLVLVDASEDLKSATIICALTEFDANGHFLVTSSSQVSASLGPAQLPILETGGFPARQQVPLLPKAKWLSIAVQDANTGNIGTLHLAVDPPPVSPPLVPRK